MILVSWWLQFLIWQLVSDIFSYGSVFCSLLLFKVTFDRIVVLSSAFYIDFLVLHDKPQSTWHFFRKKKSVDFIWWQFFLLLSSLSLIKILCLLPIKQPIFVFGSVLFFKFKKKIISFIHCKKKKKII